MFKLLEHIFINKKYHEMNNEKRSALGVLTSILALIFNVILSFFKILVGFLFSCLSIVTDGFNNLSDSLSSIISLIGFKISKKSPDENHPYGHERIEYISALILATIIIFLGISLGKTSLEKIINNEQIILDHFYILIIVVSASILIKTYMVFIYHHVYKLTNSLTINASMHDSINDCISSTIILISIIIAKFTNFSIDAYLALALCVYMIISGIKIMLESISSLLGEAPKKEEMQMIEEEILQYDKVLGAHDLIIHKYGKDKIYATIHVEMDAKDDILESHAIIDNIERNFKVKHNINLCIHLDPIELDDELTLKLKHALDDIIKDTNYGYHDFRLIKRKDEIKILFDLIISYEDNKNKYFILADIEKKLIKKAKEIKDTDYILIIDIDNKGE